MADVNLIDYAQLDRPEISAVLFHPRPAWESQRSAQTGEDILIPVAGGVSVGARFHLAGAAAPTLLFFHGNGEIAADYDEMGLIYNRMGINFIPVDYRGYGLSTGTPSVTAMMRDCHVLFDFVQSWLQKNKYGGKFVLMGRSLGSASVLELAASHADAVDALIIESGFAYTGPLLRLIGVPLDRLNLDESKGLGNLDKIRTFPKPTLIIHAEYDHIIPFADAQALYSACPSPEKTILEIPGANHNDIFLRGSSAYLSAIRQLLDGLG